MDHKPAAYLSIIARDKKGVANRVRYLGRNDLAMPEEIGRRCGFAEAFKQSRR
jgi:hypothetical protein